MDASPASGLTPGQLLELFNAGYSDYLVPLQLDQAAFAQHLDIHDVDLECSAVVADPEPAAFALLARRGGAGWVAGVGTDPAHRRRGLGERALLAGLDSARERGVTHVDLEVTDANAPAIALYEKLGFAVRRDLLVWTLPATGTAASAKEAGADAAQRWIAAHAGDEEPWQRAPATTEAIRCQGAEIRAAFATDAGGGEPAAAAVWHAQPTRVNVLGIAARDQAAATEVLLAAAGGDKDLRLTNVGAQDPASAALEALGAQLVARQHEMRIAL